MPQQEFNFFKFNYWRVCLANLPRMSLEKSERRRIHFGLFLATLICMPAFAFELWRALGGNSLSWAYVFEWPALQGYAFYMWRKLLRGDHELRASTAVLDAKTQGELDEWNAYLAKVHGTGSSESPNSALEGSQE